MKTKVKNYKHTIYASYLGYITQAIVNNFAPLLFLTFAAQFDLTLDKLTWITTINFAVQLLVDLLSAKFVDRIGYRISIMAAHLFSALGIAGLALFPHLFKNSYAGILLAVVLYAIGGGIIEVLISPIVEACPTTEKNGEMSLLHSFYCWGQVGVVLLTTIFFRAAGIANWHIMAYLWALVPIANMVYFGFVPIYPITQENEQMSIRDLVKMKVLWIAFLLMLCAGASELAMSQWASAFAESGLHVSKTAGDLLGPCAFAVLMGIARAYYGKNSEKIPLDKVMLASAALCVICYLLASLASLPLLSLLGCALCGLSVGIFWPGTFSIASSKIPTGGTAMFALLALAGDLGCSSGPTIVGLTAGAMDGNLKIGLSTAVIFPILIITGIRWMRQSGK